MMKNIGGALFGVFLGLFSSLEPVVAKEQEIGGKWQGIFSCDGFTHTFDLTVNVLAQNRLQAKFKSVIKLENRKDNREFSLIGEFSPENLFFVLKDAGKNRRSSVNLRGVFDPKTNRITGQINSNQYGSICSYIVAGRKEMSKHVKSILKKSKYDRNKRLRFDPNPKCDADVVKWAKYIQPIWMNKNKSPKRNSYSVTAGSYYSVMEILQDYNMKPFFGEGLSDFSTKELGSFRASLTRGCGAELKNLKMSRLATGYLDSVITGGRQGSLADVYIYPYVKQILQNWKKHTVDNVTQKISDGANADGTNNEQKANQRRSRRSLRRGDGRRDTQVPFVSKMAEVILLPLWPVEQGNVKGEISVAHHHVNSKKMLVEVTQMASVRPMSMPSLMKLTFFITKYGVEKEEKLKQQKKQSLKRKKPTLRELKTQLKSRKPINGSAGKLKPAGNPDPSIFVTKEALEKARAIIKDTVRQNLRPAVEGVIRQVSSPDEVLDDLQPLNGRKYFYLNQFVDPVQVPEINAVFAQRKAQLLAQFLQGEQASFKQMQLASNKGLQHLSALNQNEVRLNSYYKSILNDPNFRAFNEQRLSYRRQILRQNIGNIEHNLKQASSVAGLDRMMATYIYQDDIRTNEARQIGVTYDKRKRVYAPFTGIPGANYLNAIFRGDAAAVKGYDLEYANNYIKNYNDTLSGLGGGSPTSSLYSMEALRYKMTLLKSVAATYLFNYQKYSSRCLAKSHSVFTVTTNHPGTVTHNLLGAEVARTFGYRSQKEFKINSEFERLFRKIGSSNPNNASASFGDGFLGGGEMADVKRGTDEILTMYDCNSKVIKSFEANLRSIYASRF